MDLVAPNRPVAIFHVDDPVLLASSAGALQQSIDLMAGWAYRHNASLHLAPRKSVFMHSGAWFPDAAPEPIHPMCLPATGGGPGELHSAVAKHYLGIRWPATLDFRPLLLERLAIAEAAFGNLVALVSARVIPLTAATLLFESQVDSLAKQGRWLFSTVEDAETLLDACS